ncbi:SIN-like family protein [Euphorbia peplus]|nr:SIN-like family protein [Euphorbia peplus]
MDLDDFDDLDIPSKAPPPTSKFQPKPKFKPKGKPKSNSEPVVDLKLETGNAAVPRKEDEKETKPKIDAKPEPEPEPLVLNNGVEKMEVDAKTEEVEVVRNQDDPMDEDKQDKEVVEEEEDMIVREIDVYFNPSVDPDSQLYVMQYPLRPCWRPYELDERCEEVRVKPRTREVQIDLSIDDSTNWDHDQVRKFNMRKQTLTSSFMPSSTSGYAVGVLIGNKLSLNPVDAVVQLRPSLEHVDAKSNTGASVKVEVPNEAKPSSSKKQVKRTELENNQISEAEEDWIALKYHGSKSEFSSAYLQKMVARESSNIEFAMNPYDYLSSLCPVATNANTKSKGPSRRFLLSLTLDERIKKLLLEGPPIQQFSVLKHYAPDDTSEDLLTVLDKYGLVVQGFWTPRTGLIFSDAKAEPMKRIARDYVLLSFSKSHIIKMSELSFPMKLKEDIRSFLNVFAVERPAFKDWKFKEPTNFAFLKLHPEIVRKQDGVWKAMEENLKPFTEKAMKNTKSSAARPHAPVKQSNSEKSTPKITSGTAIQKRTSITVETENALLKTLPQVFQNHKVCSFELICEGLRNLALSKSNIPKVDPTTVKLAGEGANAPREELEEIIGRLATNIHGFYVLKSSPDLKQYDLVRKVVIDLLLERGPDAKLKRAEIFEAAKRTLDKDLTQPEYSKVMNDLCESTGSVWVLKRGDGKPSR